MNYVMNTMVAVLAFSVFATGCSKKSKGGSGRAAKTVAATPGSQSPQVPAPSEADLQRLDDTRRASPSARDGDRGPRFSDEERGRFDTSRWGRTTPPASSAPRSPVPGDDGDDQEVRIPSDGPVQEPEGPQEPIGSTEGPAGQCGTAVEATSRQWAPGLPNPPSTTRICTGGSQKKLEPGQNFQCEGNPDLVYTDARQDGLMSLAVDLFNRIPRHIDHGSRELARRIRGVKVSAGQSVRAKIKLLIAQDTEVDVEFRGVMGREAGVQLRPVNSPRNLRFSAVLTCADADGSCTNAILRLQQLSRSGKVGRVAYIVLRSGEAHVTITETDRIGFRNLSNPGHAEFAEYLSNTSYNTCVSVLRDIINGQRVLPTCATNRLKHICGRKAQFKLPAAQSFEFNSWSVAYGEAGFEFEMIDREQTRFRVQGPLVAGPSTPVLTEGLRVSGSLGQKIKQVGLVANDGGGNLNLQIDFAGDSVSHTRFSITTLIEDVRFNSEAIMARARQMPVLESRDMVDEREQREDREDVEPRRERREVLPAAQPRPRAVAPSAGRPVAVAPVNPSRPPVPVPARPANPASGKPAPVVPAKPGATGAKPVIATKPGPVTKPAPGATTPAPTPAPGRPTTAVPQAQPATDVPVVATRPLPATPGSAPRFDTAPAAPAAAPGAPAPTGVQPRETDDDETVQPRDVATPPQTAPPGPDQN